MKIIFYLNNKFYLIDSKTFYSFEISKIKGLDNTYSIIMNDMYLIENKSVEPNENQKFNVEDKNGVYVKCFSSPIITRLDTHENFTKHSYSYYDFMLNEDGTVSYVDYSDSFVVNPVAKDEREHDLKTFRAYLNGIGNIQTFRRMTFMYRCGLMDEKTYCINLITKLNKICKYYYIDGYLMNHIVMLILGFMKFYKYAEYYHLNDEIGYDNIVCNIEDVINKGAFKLTQFGIMSVDAKGKSELNKGLIAIVRWVNEFVDDEQELCLCTDTSKRELVKFLKIGIKRFDSHFWLPQVKEDIEKIIKVNDIPNEKRITIALKNLVH